MTLKTEFIESLHAILPDDESAALAHALSNTAPEVSVRANTARGYTVADDADRVPWCDNACYCAGRPAFTFDPLWHAGMYYVQDASSMFIGHVLRQLVHTPVTYLDLCGAPGGKTTAALQALPDGSVVIANEVMPQRALALCDNVSKWGNVHAAVTNDQPAAFGKRLRHVFDVIAVDAPCSGEGMMRKDATAVAQWSPALVEQCAATQRSIINDVWNALKPGGLLIYSTCTFNRRENEEIVDFVGDELGGDSVIIDTPPAWNIAGAIGSQRAAYRFMPHRTRGEGLFMAVLRKHDNSQASAAAGGKPAKRSKAAKTVAQWLNRAMPVIETGNLACAVDERDLGLFSTVINAVRTLQAGVPVMALDAPKPTPHAALAFSDLLNTTSLPLVNINDLDTMLAYLRGEAISLPGDTPRQAVTVAWEGHPIGFARNLGNRANNLYPKSWRIKSRMH